MDLVVDFNRLSFLPSFKEIPMTDFCSWKLFNGSQWLFSSCGRCRRWSEYHSWDRLKNLFHNTIVQPVHVNVFSRRSERYRKRSLDSSSWLYYSRAVFSSFGSYIILLQPRLICRRIVGGGVGRSVIVARHYGDAYVAAGRVSTVCWGLLRSGVS